jgi:hypothetical protein
MSIHLLQQTPHAINGFPGFNGIARVRPLLSVVVRLAEVESMSTKPWAYYQYEDLVCRAGAHFGLAFDVEEGPWWGTVGDAHRGILARLAGQDQISHRADSVWAYLVRDLQRSYGVPPSAIREDLQISDAMEWPVPQVQKEMQGEWKVEDCTVGGKQLCEMRGLLLVVSGARFRLDTPERAEEGTFTLHKNGQDVGIRLLGKDRSPRATGRILVEGNLLCLTVHPGRETADSEVRILRLSRRTSGCT